MDHDLELIIPNPGNRWNLFLDWGYVVGMCLQPLFCCGTTPQGLFFRQKQHSFNFWTCPISRNSTFPGFWSSFGSYLVLIEPY